LISCARAHCTGPARVAPRSALGSPWRQASGLPAVEKPDGQAVRVRNNGRSAATPLRSRRGRRESRKSIRYVPSPGCGGGFRLYRRNPHRGDGKHGRSLPHCPHHWLSLTIRGRTLGDIPPRVANDYPQTNSSEGGQRGCIANSRYISARSLLRETSLTTHLSPVLADEDDLGGTPPRSIRDLFPSLGRTRLRVTVC
jgi:hypothetical protein